MEEHPYSRTGWFCLGEAYIVEQLYEKAIDAYQYALAIDKNYTMAYFELSKAQEELGLRHTFVALDKNAPDGWVWNNTDAYIASDGLTSTIGDMVAYARQYLNGEQEYLALATQPMVEINAESSSGYFWNISTGGDVFWHDGETGHYASFLLIDRDRHLAVIILSNYGNDRFGSIRDIGFQLYAETLANGSY